jgi:hypothetical protein
LPDELKEFEDVFSLEAAGELPTHNKYEHAIELEGGEPPYGPLYNLSEKELEVLRKYLEDSLSKGWIRRSISPAGAPILFVPKKDGGLRLCVDYRGLNKVTRKNRHPLPLISETLDRLGKAVIYTKLDLKDAYYRIRIRAGDEWKTAFRTRYGHFEYCVMPFGLANAPATFQAYINQALSGLVDMLCVVYLDDILIYSTDLSKHWQDVCQVLERLRQYKLYANLSKCRFGVTSVEFLGYIVGINGVSMDKSRVATIIDWPVPMSYLDIQVFLGFANFYRRFIAKYSKVSSPLSNLLKGSKDGKKTGPFEFPKTAWEAFCRLKEAFINAPMLIHFDPSRRIRVETDASVVAIAAVISQLWNGIDGKDQLHWHPVAFYSRKLTDVEQRYETHDAELLAIVEAFKQWRHYLEGSRYPVVVKTDHNNLKYFMGKKTLNARQARWAERLAAFDFTIEYRTGKSNPADAPSRRPDYKQEGNPGIEDILPTLQNKLKGAFMTRDITFSVMGEEASVLTPQRRTYAALATSLDPAEEQEASADDGRDNEVSGMDLSRALGSPSEKQVGTPESESFEPTANTVGSREKKLLDTGRGKACGLPATGTVGCRQLVPRVYAVEAVSPETAYDLPQQSLLDLLLALQRRDAFVQDWRKKSMTAQWSTAGSNAECAKDNHELLQRKGRVQTSIDENVEREATSTRRLATRSDAKWAMDAHGLLRRNGRAYVPNDAAVKGELLKVNHNDPLAGHFGARKTQELIRRKYFWDRLAKDVKDYVKACGVCQRTTVQRHQPYGELASLPQPDRPWQEVTMDFITGLPPSAIASKAYDSILVVVDRFTKLARYIPVKKTLDASELADVFIRRIVKDLRYACGHSVRQRICFHEQVLVRLMLLFESQTPLVNGVSSSNGRTNRTSEPSLRALSPLLLQL